MKERPIIFSEELVRAILNGIKTQTRRVIKGKLKNPYGEVGDYLWVREAFREENGKVFYRANNDNGGKWKPSIYMPRKYSRILLKIKNIRVERVQDISVKDAIAEGVENPLAGYKLGEVPPPQDGVYLADERTSFARLWNKINKTRGYDWDKNPFVWVIEFERVKS